MAAGEITPEDDFSPKSSAEEEDEEDLRRHFSPLAPRMRTLCAPKNDLAIKIAIVDTLFNL